jgi:hypothetical protein
VCTSAAEPEYVDQTYTSMSYSKALLARLMVAARVEGLISMSYSKTLLAMLIARPYVLRLAARVRLIARVGL